jgi:Amt family ammonium transporter
VGLVAGALVTFSVELLDLKLEIDDPRGSISVHAVGGLWGALAVGWFGRLEAGDPGQVLARVLGIATLLGCVLPLTWAECAVESRAAATCGSRRRTSGDGPL